MVTIDGKFMWLILPVHDRGGTVGMENVCWIAGLFEELEEPTEIEKAKAVSLLLAEVESWETETL